MILSRGAIMLLLAGAALTPVGSAAADGSAQRGAATYQAHCARCHGEAADGQSRLAALLRPQPPNLRASRLSRADQERIIRLGGEANGRSALMPLWQNQLSDAEIAGVLDFLTAVRSNPPESRP
jgi:mono/diheme cytochrome c family protein